MAGIDNKDEESRVAAAITLQNRILLPYMEEAEEALRHLEKPGDATPPGAKDMLINRWKQIRDMLQQALLIHAIQEV